jgi:hypothetical protein
MMRGFLDSDQVFIKGQYRGDTLEAVAMDDPDYVQFLLKKHELGEEEETAMKTALETFGGK